MVKNITLSADEALIRRARERAARENSSFNAVFRQWLESYAAPEQAANDFRELMARLGTNRAGRKFTRDEMNERR
jgi:hypothetical protein